MIGHLEVAGIESVNYVEDLWVMDGRDLSVAFVGLFVTVIVGDALVEVPHVLVV